MKKIAVVTDSNSGITQARGKELGIFVVPMPFFINEELYFEDITLTQEEFYQRLADDADISTSQPSLGDLLDHWNKILEDYDEIVHIPMSSGLSGSCESATLLASDFDGKVQIVDNQRISVTLEQSVLDAIALKEAGKSAAEIKESLEAEKFESSIYLTVDTLKYLKKGGRVTPAAAAIGTVLNLKPVLTIQGEKLDAFAKVRGWKAAKRTMLDAMKKDLEERFKQYNGQMVLQVAYSGNGEEAEEWYQEVAETFPQFDEILMRPLSLSVACHTGPGVMALACSKKVSL